MAWVEGSPEEITAKLALLSDKLGHRLLEIRERAIASLNFKLSNDLMTFEDVGSDSGVLRALLDWFAHEDAVPTDDRALAMLRRIVEEEPTAAARLQNLGAEAALLEVADGRCSRQLAAQIESLVEKIASGGVADASAEAPAADAPVPETTETTETTDAPDDEKDDDEEAPDDEEEAPDVEEEAPAEE
jgi:rotatin